MDQLSGTTIFQSDMLYTGGEEAFSPNSSQVFRIKRKTFQQVVSFFRFPSLESLFRRNFFFFDILKCFDTLAI